MLLLASLHSRSVETSGRQGTQQPLRDGRSYPISYIVNMFLDYFKDFSSRRRTDV